MNIVKRSTEMKKPNTPVESNMNHKKNSLGRGLIFHEAKTPAKTIMDESSNMATDTPSTPTA